MKALARNQSRDPTKTAAAQLGTSDSHAADVGVVNVNAGIAEVLNVRVGYWRAPVHLWTEPSAA
jgi:hypothetical protein